MSFYGSNYTVLIEDVQRGAYTAWKARQYHERKIAATNSQNAVPCEQSLDKILKTPGLFESEGYHLMDMFDEWAMQIARLTALTGYTVECLWAVWAESIAEAVHAGGDVDEAWTLFVDAARELDL